MFPPEEDPETDCVPFLAAIPLTHTQLDSSSFLRRRMFIPFERHHIFNIFLLVSSPLVNTRFDSLMFDLKGRNDSLAAVLLLDRPPRYSHIIDMSRPRRRCGCSTDCSPSCGKRQIRRRTGIEYPCSFCEIYRVDPYLLLFLSHVVVVVRVCIHRYSDLEFKYNHAS